MIEGKSCKPYDCIHWCTDVMGHIRKEHGLCMACTFCHGKSILKKLLLLHFMLNLIINIHESKKKISCFLDVSNANNLKLHVLKFVVDVRTEIYIESFAFDKLTKNVVPGECHTHHVTVIGIH